MRVRNYRAIQKKRGPLAADAVEKSGIYSFQNLEEILADCMKSLARHGPKRRGINLWS